MVRIAPSILAADFARLAEDIERVEAAGADWLHIDVMDGQFVPYLPIGPPVIAAIKAVTRLPYVESRRDFRGDHDPCDPLSEPFTDVSAALKGRALSHAVTGIRE